MKKYLNAKTLSLTVLILIAIAVSVWSFSGDNSAADDKAADTGTDTESGTAGEGSAETAAAGYKIGNIMPDFTVNTVDGDVFTLSEHSDKVVFINLFATWCSPCMNEMPDIQELYEKYKDDVYFIAIDVGDAKNTAIDFAGSSGYTFPMAYSEDGAMGDYTVRSIPQSFILSDSGVIAFYAAQMSDYETFSDAIENLLAD
ncbi:MAG: TlpA family protein disulfide reductase [Oscillospiraceae bacterium]